MENIKLREGQNIFDVLIAKTGAISSLFDVLNASELLTNDLPADTDIKIESVLKQNVVDFFDTKSVQTEDKNIYTGTIENSTVTVAAKNSNGDVLQSSGFSVGTTGELNIDDSSITINGTPFIDVPAEQPLNIELVDETNTPITPDTIVGNKIIVASGSTFLSTATLMKTGQTTSYRLHDDGYDQIGRDVNFFVLSQINVFGHNFRFCGITGGYTDGVNFFTRDGSSTTKIDAFPYGVSLDFSVFNGTKVIGFVIELATSGNIKWEDAFLYIESLSLAGYNDWRMPNFNEGCLIYNHELDVPFDYSPFNDTLGVTFWTSTTLKAYSLTGYAKVIRRDGPAYSDKTGLGGRAVAVRDFSLSELVF